MLYIIILLVAVYAILKYKVNCEREYEEEQRLKEEKQKKIQRATENGKSYYTERWDSRRELRVDIKTGQRYREELIGNHTCHFNESGRLIRDLTKEKLERDLGKERERAIKEGRRLYMSDNRSMRFGLQDDLYGVRYTDVITGREYTLGAFGWWPEVILLIDVETLFVYDVVKQKDGRGYLETPNGFKGFIAGKKVCNLQEYIEKLNRRIQAAQKRKDKITEIKSQLLHTYVIGESDTGAESESNKASDFYWSKMLDVDVRDEFKNTESFPIIL